MTAKLTTLPEASPSHDLAEDMYELSNRDITDRCTFTDLGEMVAAYEIDGLPFTVQRFPAGETNTEHATHGVADLEPAK